MAISSTYVAKRLQQLVTVTPQHVTVVASAKEASKAGPYHLRGPLSQTLPYRGSPAATLTIRPMFSKVVKAALWPYHLPICCKAKRKVDSPQ